ncbi:MAG: cardiolipin synthase [Candidatus Sumerlaeia bacterium]|nr:cardiolipin synthase [Candidatus Sumerlaeia bacterium]
METLQNISLGLVLHIVLLTATIPRILRIKRDATAAIAWMLFVFLMPLVGTVCFWAIGDPEMRRSIRRVIVGPPIHRVPRARIRRRVGSERLQRIMRRLHETPMTSGNLVEFTTEGAEFYAELERELAGARHEICFQFYIFRNDECGRRFARVLERKASEGVHVFFLYDAIGSQELRPSFIARMRRAGVQCHPFLPFNPLRRRVQINFRNHRKLVIVDRRVAFTGGINIGCEYTGASRRARRWFDAHVRVEGKAVPQMYDEFAADWTFASETDSSALDPTPMWFEAPDQMPRVNPRRRGAVQTVSSGPDQPVNRMRTLMFSVITSARRRLWIATPYLVPDEAILTALQTAALAGVDVRILMQGTRPDKWVPWFAANYFARPLMEAGVRVFRYQPGMMHAKMLLADEDFATVGSANLDVRSLALNFELNLVFYSRWEIARVERLFERALEESEELGEEFLRRPWYTRIHEEFCRLFAPVL